MVIRLVVMFLLIVLCFIFVKIFSLGHDFEKGPLTGCRNTLISYTYKIVSRLLLILSGTGSSQRFADVNYTRYLG